MVKLKYIDSSPSKGLLYDWKKIRKEFHKYDLIPKEYYDPCTAPLDSVDWYVEVSERAVGKTTAWLLLGLVMYKLYGTVTIYVRSKREMIAPKNAISLYNVILGEGYVSKIFDGEYNHIIYKSRKWFPAYIDEEGNIVRISSTYCARMVSIDDAGQLKSSFNEPRGDLLLYDEFIPINPRENVPNEIVQFIDLMQTVFRLRLCCKVVLLANTLDRYNQYFHDLEIFDTVSCMHIGERITRTVSDGTKIYIEMIGAPEAYRKQKESWVRKYAPFAKPELSSVTGRAAWAIKMYQHIPAVTEEPKKDVSIDFGKLYIYSSGQYLRLDIVTHEELGTLIYVHWATRVYEDSLILTTETMHDKRYIWGIGQGTKIYTMMDKALKLHKVYFAANDVGAFFENYLSKAGYVAKIVL